MFELLGKNLNSFKSSNLFEISKDKEEESLDERLYINLNDLGLEFLFNMDDDALDTIFIYKKGYSFLANETSFSKNIDFDMSRDDINSNIGSPISREIEGEKTILGLVKPWDVYHISSYKIHLQYTSKADSIETISVSKC